MPALPNISDSGLGIPDVLSRMESPGAGYLLQAPLTGFSITLLPSQRRLILQPAGTLAAGTITFPAANVDAERLYIRSTQTITAITLSGSSGSGQSVIFTPTGLAQDITYEFVYVAINSTWI